MQRKWQVGSKSLNLRRDPVIRDDNILAALPQGQVVESDQAEVDGWIAVSTNLGGVDVLGFVAVRYLIASNSNAMNIPPANLSSSGVNVTRKNRAWAYSLNEPAMPWPNTQPANPPSQLNDLVEWLDSENSKHKRYWPKKNTYCNIYAHDYCYLAGSYLPRVWWTSKAIVALSNGKHVVAKWGKTANELNANSLYDWFVEWGDDFGWRRGFDLTQIQDAANSGHCVVISGRKKNPNKSGHITVVVPETSAQRAKRDGAGNVIAPLQSQAGRKNRSYFSSIWWQNSSWHGWGAWIRP